ncbi:hypothetical protein [Qipengyuania seohaensis]|uniref:hypothetical protein n=1 Tax=Qipengyuania seohaensis TaxID=266951 RepID=UPI0012FE482E|nr:hypothetical protein [Qipengyuania seohaensis]
MTTFRSSVLSASLLLLISCGASETPIDLPDLTDAQKAERMQLCMGQIGDWRELGVWVHGGSEPAVNRDAWEDLSSDDQQNIADIAACIQASGDWAPQEVQIVSEGFKVPIEKLQSRNTLFYEKFQ